MTNESQDPTPRRLPSWDIVLHLDGRPPPDATTASTCTDEKMWWTHRHADDDADAAADADAARAPSAWRPHGSTAQGFLVLPDRPGEHVRARAPPSVAAHRGQLWAMWTDFDGATYHAATTPESLGGAFGPRARFPADADPPGGDELVPALANLNGELHAVVASAATGRMAHYAHRDPDPDGGEPGGWARQEGPPAGCRCAAAGGDAAGEGGATPRGPALAAFHNKLFLAWVGAGGALAYAALDARSGAWSPASPVPPAPVAAFQGRPALFVVDGALHLLCESAGGGGGGVVGYRYGRAETGWTWSPADDASWGPAAAAAGGGVSAASLGGRAYLGFLGGAEGDAACVAARGPYDDDEDGDGDGDGDGDQARWGAPERVGGAAGVRARSPPQVAVVNGRVHCLLAGRWRGDLHWFSRPALAGRDPGRWMAGVPDGAWLSGLTVPGTHDSCARSRVPFVRTQYLGVAQQLALGIRFLDLRLRAHDDGRLYCYHGGVPIGLPRGLSFDEVMGQVWDFIGPRDGRRATETVLVSINNDDRSEEQKERPQDFYNAVKAAVESTPRWDDGSERWHVEPVTARLGDVRGKAVLLRRYHGDPDVEATERMGLDLEKWLDDNPDFTITTPTGVRVRLQDKWKYARRCELDDLIASKQGYVQKMMEEALGLQPGPGREGEGEDEDGDPEKTWFINFCSAVGDPVEHGEVAEAKWIAVGAHSDYHFFGGWVEGMNVRTRDYLRSLGSGKKRLGVVNLDYPELPEDSDLVARLIATNF